MKAHLVVLLLVLSGYTCFAQTDCKPILKYQVGDDFLPSAIPHDEVPAIIRVIIQPNPKCQNGITYEIFRGSAYIVKNNQLVDEIPMSGSTVQNIRWQYQMQAGDRISFKITHLYAINSKGEKKPIIKSLTGSIEIK